MELLEDIFGDKNVGPVERVLSMAAGTAVLAYAARFPKRWGGLPFVLGGNLVWRGVTGRSRLYADLGIRRAGPAREAMRGEKVSRSVIVRRPREELYAFWRNFENLPRVMRHVEAVTVEGDTLSRWKVRGPAGSTLEWEAEVVRDIPNELITWQTLQDARVIHAGSVAFQPVQDGTEVKVILRYDPPAGALGRLAASLLGEDPGRQVELDLEDFRKLAEAGDLPAFTRIGAEAGNA